MMNLKKSLLFFGIPGIWLFVNFQYILPILTGSGLSLLNATLIMMALPILGVVAYVFWDYWKSGMKADGFFYCRRLTVKEVILCIAVFFGGQVLELKLAVTRNWLVRIPGFATPAHYPDLLKPDYAPQFPVEFFMGTQLKGNYMIILLWALWLVVNIGGEELIWRGYALPRMEKYFGKWAWLVNGLMWNILFHMFIRWSWISLLPVSLAIPYIAQRTKSLWPGIIIHGIGNALVYVLILPGIF